MNDESIIHRLPGFPLPHIFKYHYIKIKNIGEIDETYINKDVIILVLYKKLIAGNIHRDFMYIGKIINTTDETYIYIKDTRINKMIHVRKTRFINDFELYIRKSPE